MGIIENEEKLEKAIASIGERLKEYFGKLADTNELARYKQGKLAIDVAAIFIGAGEAKAGKSSVELLENFVANSKGAEEIGQALLKSTSTKEALTELFANIDDIAKLFNEQSLLKTIKIDGKLFTEVAGGNGKTVKIFEGVTDANIKLLAQNIAGKQLKEVSINKVWTATSSDGIVVNLRNVSSSAIVTEAKWTIELPNSLVLKDSKGNGIKLEIKFK